MKGYNLKRKLMELGRVEEIKKKLGSLYDDPKTRAQHKGKPPIFDRNKVYKEVKKCAQDLS